jgi:hypothetical protein
LGGVAGGAQSGPTGRVCCEAGVGSYPSGVRSRLMSGSVRRESQPRLRRGCQGILALTMTISITSRRGVGGE